MNATIPQTPPLTRPLHPSWWLAPALFTVAAVQGGAWGYRSSPIAHATAWLALPYAVPLALMAVSWRSSSDLAPTSDTPDFLAEELAGGRAFTGYMMDLGLIAVSADEVGVFWSFNAL
ncbi:hypothetical protein [Streptomyces sp. NBC_01443]|uniref:hypothetical protein n=1 Tax=Streptomyces sp. NBC_01443 TaxID=2903868 RepID=UPI00225A7161|nr:hypothetical protein [Streptomyces sp. NBC_01443]MCX4633479.1 hypothetical protein [Streptomyces sp. NBC_01443]